MRLAAVGEDRIDSGPEATDVIVLRCLSRWGFGRGTGRGPRWCLRASELACICAVLAGCGLPFAHRAAQTRTCVYSGDTLAGLRTFDALVGSRITCAVVFDTAAPNWSAWDRPWFTYNPIPDENWSHFAATPGHRLVITVSMFPSSLNGADWRSAGAAGDYARYARALARNLVADGMGHAVIRLGHEANGTWFADNIGNTPAQWAQWREFWRKTVFAMRSVKNAHFSFDWCIAAGYRAIPLRDYYPGDDVVDSIGVDVYDNGVPTGENRWTYQYDRPGGVRAVVRFARAHHKPVAIPEWGLQATSAGGGGDDPTFVSGIAGLAARTSVSFQSYFFAEGSLPLLSKGSGSLAAYRHDLLSGS